MTTFKNLPSPPPNRDEILAAVGPQRAQIYHTVRKILDDFEVVARWEQLYYPPTEIEEFLRIQTCLLSLIEEIPYRISELSVRILTGAFEDLLGRLSAAELDEETRQMIEELLVPSAAQAATQSTRKMAFDAIDDIPAASLGAAPKQLLKWMIDRHSPEPCLELTGEGFEDAVRSFPAEVIDDSMQEILSNIQFYFDGIHEMTGGDLQKLRSRIELFQTAEAAHLSPQERVFTCEIGADLKGKYTSSMMGAAANLISEGLWNGAEVEPILFPEKADEFARNDQLVAALREVLASIGRLPEEVPLVDLVACWDSGKRIDRYALSHLYGFLGNLGKLMRESSRRALYSGDYHQIQMREHRLSNRVNELNMLHNKSWEVLDDTDPDIQDTYPQMVDKAVELAAILDVELLKKLIGEDTVRLVLQVVSLEAEKRKELDVRLGKDLEKDYRTPESIALRQQIPVRRQPLIELLYDEDLQTFVELLLGSVVKRASFAVKQRRAVAAPGAGAEAVTDPASHAGAEGAARPPETTGPPEETVHFEDLSVLDLEILPEPRAEPRAGEAAEAPSAPEPAAAPEGATDRYREKRAALAELRRYLEELGKPTNPRRKSFDLVHRLLARKGMIPPSMMQSIVPFLENLTDVVVPQLAKVSAQGDLPITYQSELLQYCRDLSRRDLTPQEMKIEVMTNMEGLVRLMGDLEAVALELADSYSAASSDDSEQLSSVEDFLNPHE